MGKSEKSDKTVALKAGEEDAVELQSLTDSLNAEPGL